MEIAALGKVQVQATIQNVEDLYDVERGRRKPAEVRTVEVSDALVDTGATMLSMPRSLIEQLGLLQFRTRIARTDNGLSEFPVFSTVRLQIQGRECRVDVTQVADDCPVLIGQVPLELLDFVVDPQNQKLIGDPAHGGVQMIDMF